jgi:NAD(P)H-hydrate epimerase
MMTEGLPETDEGTIALTARSKLESLLRGKDAIVIGPGLSQHPETSAFVREVVKNSLLPVVLDADGLNAFDGHYTELRPRGYGVPLRVLTPHPGEAGRLIGMKIAEIQTDRLATARRMARETGSCVVFKGSGTLVAGAGGGTWINMTGNPAMAKGGSGDVLSGIIGAALARRREATSTFLDGLHVAAAVYLHGLAGDLARDLLHENSVVATDLLDALAEAFHDCESQAKKQLFYLQK